MLSKIIQFIFLILLFVLLQVYADNFIITEFFTVFCFLIIFLFFNIKFDFEHLFSPVNLALFIFFIRLYIVPCTAIFYGYSHWWQKSFDIDLVFEGHLVTLGAFLFFSIGWTVSKYNSRFSKKEISEFLSKRQLKIIMITFFIFGVLALYLYFGDLQTYLNNIFVITSYEREDANKGNELVGIFASFSRYFLPFVIFCYYSLVDIKSKTTFSKILIYFSTAVLMLLFTLNTNRQSMVYPLFAMIVAVVGDKRVKILPTVGAFLVSFYFLFLFQDIRSNKDYSFESESENSSLKMVQNVQIYIGASNMVTPIFKDKSNEYNFTIINSFLQSLPVIGKPFRENSGVEYYNRLFYGGASANDQVYITHAEAYKSGGVILLAVIFFTIGYCYQLFNKKYHLTLNSQFLHRATFYYLFLLFNSLILLSFQVAGQYLFYNAISGLIILFIYKKNKTRLIL